MGLRTKKETGAPVGCVTPLKLFGLTIISLHKGLQDTVLSQGGPRDAAVNFNTYRILQQHCARLLCHGTAFLLVFVCRLQWIICQKVTSTRKNQSDRIFNADK